jgi:hypothetical protein
MGRDWSEVMNFDERSQQFPNQSDDVIFRQIVASYPEFGPIPDAAAALRGTPTMTEQVPNQVQTDLAYVRALAQRNGYVFFVEPVTIGVNRAYFGPQLRVGFPQPALTHNMGADSNLTQISLSYDALAEALPTGKLVEPNTGAVIPIQPQAVVKGQPLAARRTVLRTTILRDIASQTSDQALASLLSAALNAPDPVQGTGQLDSLRYGAVLRARRLVGLRGVGARFDGLYYVNRVSHAITRTDYSQQFSLAREGTYSTVPVVPT